MGMVVKADERLFCFEMVNEFDPHIGRRLRALQAMMDAAQVDEGCPYWELPETYVIAICEQDPFGLGEPIYTIEYVCDEAPDLALDDDTHWMVLNAEAWAEARDADVVELLRYINTGEVTGPLSQKIDDHVEELGQDDPNAIPTPSDQKSPRQEKLVALYETGVVVRAGAPKTPGPARTLIQSAFVG